MDTWVTSAMTGESTGILCVLILMNQQTTCVWRRVISSIHFYVTEELHPWPRDPRSLFTFSGEPRHTSRTPSTELSEQSDRLCITVRVRRWLRLKIASASSILWMWLGRAMVPHSDIYDIWPACEATCITSDPPFPPHAHSGLSLLLSGRKYRSLWVRITRLGHSLVHQAVRMLDSLPSASKRTVAHPHGSSTKNFPYTHTSCLTHATD